MTGETLRRRTFRSFGPGAALLVFPLALNLAIYRGVVRPLQAGIAASRQAQLLHQLKPSLESSLTEGARILTEWRRTSFSVSDPSAVMQTLQQLASTHGVRITTLKSETRTASSGTYALLELQVSGRFGRLAHWVGDLERRSGFRIESWTLSQGQGPQDPEQLTIKLTAPLRGAS